MIKLNSIAYFFYILSLIFAPLSFGTTEKWSFFLLMLFAGLSFLFFIFSASKDKNDLYKVPGTGIFFAGLLYVVLQLIKLPGSVVKFLSPNAFELRNILFEGISVLQLSLNVEGGIITLCQLVTFYLVFYLSIQFFSDYKKIKKTIYIISIFAGLLAISSILQFVMTTDRVLWFRYVPVNSMAFGPYVNHNHYAGLMEMLLPLVIALYYSYKPSIGGITLREKILSFFERDFAYVYILFGFFSCVIMVSVFMSLSRGGSFSMIASLIFFYLFIKTFFKKRRIGLSAVFIVLLVLAGISWFGWSKLDSRFGRTIHQFENQNITRLTFWKDTAEIIKDFPLTGTGAGSFEQIYPFYQSFISKSIIGHAHNDFMELYSDFGMLGVMIAFFFLFKVLTYIFKNLKKRKEKYVIYTACGGLAGLFAVFIHSIVDFNFQIPGNAYIFFLILGVCVSLSHTRFRSAVSEKYIKISKINKPIVHFFIFIIFWSPAAIFSGKSALAKIGLSELAIDENGTYLTLKEINTYRKNAETISSFNSFNSSYKAAIGDSYFFKADFKSALSEYEKSLELSPLSGEIIQKYGLCLLYSGEQEKGLKLLYHGVEKDKNNSKSYLRLSSYLFESGKKNEAIQAVKTGILVDPAMTKSFIDLAWQAGLNFTDIEKSLPDNSVVWFKYYSYIKKLGYEKIFLIRVLEKGYGFTVHEENPDKGLLNTLTRIYILDKQFDKAFEVADYAYTKYPKNAYIVFLKGYVYEKKSIFYKAEKYYRKALVLNPKMKTAADRLDNIQQ